VKSSRRANVQRYHASEDVLKDWSSNTRILLGFALGAGSGLAANLLWYGNPRLTWFLDQVSAPIGDVFIRLIFMIILPLIISALILGVTGLGDLERLRRLGIRYLLLTALMATVMVGAACLFELLIKPGTHVSPTQRAAMATRYGVEAALDEAQAKQFKGVLPALVELIPDNPVRHLASALTVHDEGHGLPSVLIFSLFLGVAILVGPAKETEALERFFRSLFAVSMNVIGFAIRLTPFCIIFVAFDLTARLGLDLLASLSMYLLTFLLVWLFAFAVVFPLCVRWLAGRSPVRFYGQVRSAFWFAFVTSSTSATYPIALRTATEKLGISDSRARFVLTLGAVANQSGSAIFLAVSSLFLADIFGIPLSGAQRMEVFALSVAAAFATPGVPGGNLPLLATFCLLFGIPPRAVAVVVSVDRLLDMGVTTVNVVGDLVVAAVLGRVRPGRGTVEETGLALAETVEAR